VEDGVELCARTPCDILYTGMQAEPSRSHSLTFSRQGFRPETRSVSVGNGPVTVKLAKKTL
jgi:hypothetical protein